MAVKTILTVVGARPQIIKAAALGRVIREQFNGQLREVLVHTGQHYDANMSQVFFEELGIQPPSVRLNVGSGNQGEQTARMIEGLEHTIADHRPDLVLVYGDTNSTLAGALAAVKLHVPVAHVEAGLRSFDKRMPEEVNRVVCDHCSTWLFCPTATAVKNLEREGFNTTYRSPATVNTPHVVLSGDVMLDNSLYYAQVARERSTMLADRDLAPGGYMLATVHRAHNTDDPVRFSHILQTLLDLVMEHGLPLVLPLHPRAIQRLEHLTDKALRDRLLTTTGVHIIPPAGYLDMIALESNARLVLTDSGGVQKEAGFFGRPVVVLRAETEWVELVESGDAMLADADPDRIRAATSELFDRAPGEPSTLFGDGRAAESICEHLIGHQ